MTVAAVVADANVLLSAVIGKAALRVFTEHEIAVHVTAFNAAEVEKYLPRLTAKYRLPAETVRLQWHLLPFVHHEESVYAAHLETARVALADRDLDDAHPLALALHLELPLWSNDRDLEGHAVPCWPTAKLLRALEA